MNYDFLTIEYAVVALAVMILYLIYYIFTKDTEASRNIRSIAAVVEDLNREVFYIKKKLEETQNSIENNSQRMNDDEIYQEIERSVYDMTQPLSIALKQMQESVHAIDSQIESRVASLETGVKQISIPSSIHGNDEEKIISLFKQGMSIEDISRDLRVSKAEVEFVLKINKIK